VLFHALDRTQLRRITELMLAQTAVRLAHQGITLRASEAALDWLAEHGHQPELGARPLRRTIAREVERALSRLIISGDLGSGQPVQLDVADGALTLIPGKKL
jgi:ATP-dependent Clp protease ATP-binding subunit ClpC